MTKMAEIVSGSRGALPTWLVDEMPESPDDMREAIAAWFRDHAADWQTMGKDAGRVLIYALIGMIFKLGDLGAGVFSYFLSRSIVKAATGRKGPTSLYDVFHSARVATSQYVAREIEGYQVPSITVGDAHDWVLVASAPLEQKGNRRG